MLIVCNRYVMGNHNFHVTVFELSKIQAPDIPMQALLNQMI